MSSIESVRQDVVAHPAFKAAERELKAALENPRRGKIIFLIGMSGSGKTWIRHSVARQLFGQPQLWPVGVSPYIEVSCLMGDRGYFTPKDLANAVLMEANAPSPRWLYLDPDVPLEEVAPWVRSMEANRVAWFDADPKDFYERVAWRKAIALFQSRGIQVLAIEHANLMCVNRADGSPAHHMLNLMSFANDAGIDLVITTTPEGQELWMGYPEVSRRSIKVFVRPYDIAERKELDRFATLIKKLQGELVFSPPDLLKNYIPLFAGTTNTSAGGVKAIMVRARVSAEARGSAAIELVDLEKALPSRREVLSVETSAVMLGEAMATAKLDAPEA